MFLSSRLASGGGEDEIDCGVVFRPAERVKRWGVVAVDYEIEQGDDDVKHVVLLRLCGVGVAAPLSV